MNWLTIGVAFLDYYWHKKKRKTGLTLGETHFLFFAFGLIWICYKIISTCFSCASEDCLFPFLG